MARVLRQTRANAFESSPNVSEAHSFNAGWLITAYVIALFIVPANLVVPQLGAAGTPAILIGLFALMWWLGGQLNRSSATLAPRQPIRAAMFIFSIAILLSYLAASIRPLSSIESNSADRGLLLLASWLGVVLLSADGLFGLGAIEAPLRVLVAVGGIAAIIGIAQFATGLSIIDWIQIPGLSPNNAIKSVTDRDGFNRAAGTATHPIEFGVALSMILPIALHFAFRPSKRGRIWKWLPILAIGIAVPIAISRSALLAVVVALIVILPSWPKHRRRVAYVTIAALVVVVYLTIPGLLGSLTRLFTGIGNDDSVSSRTDSYALAFEFVQRYPVFGRGFSTFLPQYRILDNQYLGLLIEAGIVGVVALLGLLVVTITTGFRARDSVDPAVKSLATSLIAAVAAGASSLATFDAFGFAQVSCLLFLCIGVTGALSNTVLRPDSPWRLLPKGDELK